MLKHFAIVNFSFQSPLWDYLGGIIGVAITYP